MIAAILTDAPTSNAVRQLTEVGGLRGHEMVIVDYRLRIGNLFDSGVNPVSPKDWFLKFKAIFAWLDLKDLNCGLSVMRQSMASGAFLPNTTAALDRTCNRFWLAQTLAQFEIPTPRSFFVRSTDDAAGLLGSMGDGPFVIKRLNGQATFDQFVVTETQEGALLAIDQLRKQKRDFLLQRYIAEAKCSDVRVIVVGGSVIAAILRTAKATAFLPLSDFTRVSIVISSKERDLAEASAKALDLKIADVTLLRSNLGPLVLDVNPFPQLEWWDLCSGESVANQLIDLIEQPATTQ